LRKSGEEAALRSQAADRKLRGVEANGLLVELLVRGKRCARGNRCAGGDWPLSRAWQTALKGWVVWLLDGAMQREKDGGGTPGPTATRRAADNGPATAGMITGGCVEFISKSKFKWIQIKFKPLQTLSDQKRTFQA
jgi:hypothetical protein